MISENHDVWIAIPAALCAALSYGSAGVLQHRATHQAPERPPLRPRLLLDLIGLRAFRSGAVLAALGFILQVVALRFGPLTLVQPILVTGLLFYLGIASAMRKQWPDHWLLLGAVMTLLGLSGFLLAAEPKPGTGSLDSDDAFPLGLALAAAVAVCLAVSSRLGHEARTVPLAAATAVFYGVTAGLISSLVSVSSSDGGVIWQKWELYAVIVVGPMGFLLSQNAYQTGLYGSVALAIMTVGDPLVSIGIGVLWLDERIDTGAVSAALQGIALTLMTAGVVVLAARAQSLAERLQSGQVREAPPG